MKNSDVIITTNRLILREFSADDAESFYLLNSDTDVMQYTGDLAFKSVQDSAEFISNYNSYRKSGFGRWTVLLKDTNESLGWCGLKLHPDKMVDLGYRFHKRHWNNGYATEAATACIQYGFDVLNIDEIVGRTAFANKSSIRVLEKIGMKFWKEAPCEGIEASVYYRINRPFIKK